MNTLRYILYARKSTKSREKQVLSIPSQLKILRNFAKDQQLNVVAEVVERESAHAPGRPRFNDMLRRIEAGEANGILAWHPDRLARNGLDGGSITTYLDRGSLVDLKFPTFWFENTPQGKSNLGHEFVQTKQFSDKLSCDTKRGLDEKAARGLYPNRAPRGYLNDRATKTITIDPHLAPIVKEAFELFSKGDKTLDHMRNFFAERGVVTRKLRKRKLDWGGNKLHVEFIRRMLRNPFYYGDFEYAGERYEGKHKPIISKRLFDKVQVVLAKRTLHLPEVPTAKVFTKLLRCGECKMAITASIQKGHTYYHCTKKSKSVTCSQHYIREEALALQLSTILLEYAIPATAAAEILSMAERDYEEFSRDVDSLVREKEREHLEVKEQLIRLTTLYIDRDIDRESFITKKDDLLSRKRMLNEAIDLVERDTAKAWLEPLRDWLKTAQRVGEIATTGSLEERKQLLAEIFGSNLFLESQKARGCALKPWSLLLHLNEYPSLVPVYQSARTHLEQKGGS